MGTGTKKEESSTWARLGCCISPCYGPFSLGTRFETYELLFHQFSNFFQATVTVDIESVDTEACLYNHYKNTI
jgi:hypothetical protein